MMQKYQEEWLDESQMTEWDAFVASSPEGNPFSTSTWLRAFRRACPSGSTRVLVLRNKAREIISGVALFINRNRLGQERVIAPSLHQYTSFLFAPIKTSEPDRVLASRLDRSARMAEILEACGFESIRLVHHPHVSDVRSLMWRNWEIYPAYTFHLDVASCGDEKTFSRAQRKRLRRGRKEEYRFEEVGLSAKATILNLIEDTFRRQHLDSRQLSRYCGGLEAYSSYFDSLSAGKILRCFQTTHPTLGVGAVRVGVLGAGNIFYDFMAGNATSQLPFSCGAFTIFSLLRILTEEGVTTFDFGGANTPGVADFKQTFNGRLVMAYDTRWKSSKVKHQLARGLGNLAHRMRTLVKPIFCGGSKAQPSS